MTPADEAEERARLAAWLEDVDRSIFALHELGWQQRGTIRALFGIGSPSWRAFCNTCGAEGPWTPGRPTILTTIEHPREDR